MIDWNHSIYRLLAVKTLGVSPEIFCRSNDLPSRLFVAQHIASSVFLVKNCFLCTFYALT